MAVTHTPKRILVTGGAGFIGANFIRLILATKPEVSIANLDLLTYAGGVANLAGVPEAYGDRYRFFHADIRDQAAVADAFAQFAPDTVVNFAAESHVDRSIDNPVEFVTTNVVGTAVLLDAARQAWQGRADVRYHQVSTDEVYGSLGGEGEFTEESRYDPSSPYSASKAGADHLVQAWGRTFGLPVTGSNCSNNYGPWQFPEKLIPLFVANALEGKPLPLYGQGKNVRDWLHVEDHCRAVWTMLTRAAPGSRYNVGGDNEWANIDLVTMLCGMLDNMRPRAGGGSYADLITLVPDRPGHDLRYAVDSARIRRELGWRPEVDFRFGLEATVRWYVEHQDWVNEIRARKYDGKRLGQA